MYAMAESEFGTIQKNSKVGKLEAGPQIVLIWDHLI
jgi:hypothetical protein